MPEETPGGCRVPSLLQRHVNDFTILVDGPPQVSLLTLDPNKDLLDPATGEERWRFDATVKELRQSEFTSRGVAQWQDAAAPAGAPCRRGIFAATIESRLFALDAATGKRCVDFGREGEVSLKEGIGEDRPYGYGISSPPTLAGDVVVVGSAIGDNARVAETKGIVRGYDARSGRLLWAWDPIPRSGADPAYAEWPSEGAALTGAAYAWSILSYDAERDLVFFNTVEINSSFYSPASPGYVYNWVRRVPGDFLFTVKLWQKFTHPQMYKEATGEDAVISQQDVDLFNGSIEPLIKYDKLGALLAQFPPSFKNDTYGKQILSGVISKFGQYRLAVELSHKSWSDDPGIARLLGDNNVAGVKIDEPKFKSSVAEEVPVTSDMACFRFHGRNAEMWWKGDSETRYKYLYSPDEIKELTDKIKAAAEKTRHGPHRTLPTRQITFESDFMLTTVHPRAFASSSPLSRRPTCDSRSYAHSRAASSWRT